MRAPRVVLQDQRLRDALPELIGWWTGRPAIEALRLEHSVLALIAADARLRSLAPACPVAARERLRDERGDTAKVVRVLVEEALSAGLLARVNTYLALAGLITPNVVALGVLRAWRALACGDRLGLVGVVAEA